MGYEKIPSVVKMLCSIKGVTQKEALKNSGAGEQFVKHIKEGSAPSIEKCQALAVYFGVSLDYLVGNTDVPEVNRAEETPQMALARAIVALPPAKQEMISKLVADLAALNSK